MRILLVEDDLDVGESLKSNLETDLFSVDLIFDGVLGLKQAKLNNYDLLIIDGILPGMVGVEICSELRQAGKTTPILMLTVESEIPSKVAALNAGADDYLTKPFSYEELLARVRALLRRPQKIQEETLRIDGLFLDVTKNFVSREGSEIHLTTKEYQLLEYLMRNKGVVVSRGMIVEHVWDSRGDIFSNSIETHILNLRRKIEKEGKPKLIKTISGRGYKIG